MSTRLNEPPPEPQGDPQGEPLPLAAAPVIESSGDQPGRPPVLRAETPEAKRLFDHLTERLDHLEAGLQPLLRARAAGGQWRVTLRGWELCSPEGEVLLPSPECDSTGRSRFPFGLRS
jgi:hypothetical protein